MSAFVQQPRQQKQDEEEEEHGMQHILSDAIKEALF